MCGALRKGNWNMNNWCFIFLVILNTSKDVCLLAVTRHLMLHLHVGQWVKPKTKTTHSKTEKSACRSQWRGNSGSLWVQEISLCRPCKCIHLTWKAGAVPTCGFFCVCFGPLSLISLIGIWWRWRNSVRAQQAPVCILFAPIPILHCPALLLEQNGIHLVLCQRAIHYWWAVNGQT